MQGAISKARHEWRLFRDGDPGHRFQDRYRRRRDRRKNGEVSGWVRPFNLFGGAVLVVAGFAFLPTPGPSYIIIVLGLWMMAGEWSPLAQTFDRLEPRLRTLWRRTPGMVKVLMALLLVAVLVYLALEPVWQIALPTASVE